LKTVGNHYSGEGPGATAGHAGSSSEFVSGQKSSHCFHSISGESFATGLPVGDWQNINLSPFDLGYSPHCRFGKKTPQAGTHYLKVEKRGQ